MPSLVVGVLFGLIIWVGSSSSANASATIDLLCAGIRHELRSFFLPVRKPPLCRPCRQPLG